jgi:hypothetical protein
MKPLIAALGFMMLALGGCLSFRGAPSPDLEYFSDYFSFVGQDEHGPVAFALDNNRGRAGHSFQAEHFVVLHDAAAGWVSVRGDGRYPNPAGVLATIPDSADFHFEGSPTSGLAIASPSNGLRLAMAPLTERTRRSFSGSGEVVMATAPATLFWRGRTLPGRVIHEGLAIPGANRMVRKVVGAWKDFQGLYLMVGAGEGDLYLHHQATTGPGATEGFLVEGEETLPFSDLVVQVPRRAAAFGFYRWPAEWRVSGRTARGPFVLTLSAQDRNGISNWLVGGFSMAVARGELEANGRRRAVQGLAELLR